VLEECGRACRDDEVVRGTYKMLAQSTTEEVVIRHGVRVVACLARHWLEWGGSSLREGQKRESATGCQDWKDFGGVWQSDSCRCVIQRTMPSSKLC
jgi:hypothetical protein